MKTKSAARKNKVSHRRTSTFASGGFCAAARGKVAFCQGGAREHILICDRGTTTGKARDFPRGKAKICDRGTTTGKARDFLARLCKKNEMSAIPT